ncbi:MULTISPECIES: RNA recognition motif domain-containing protein [Halobacteriovorax]|uniref:RNA-binding protein n=1 Tax=Halobacteriovorax vibrionivorans TaxID=2152716 RepID=A0ABY0IFE1_9BACT|nr:MULTISPECIES: RNA-binding protein [Halobacteriovorax]AYF43823.1 hypothetical protein BALOs_0813 [Halobacteriovorax sp. BALOs_7]RZF21644.1 RNA-binding protein [Halobacteriovorax vibrionivorans]TGD49063.1 RNA-binding protein [Halobacteriovorax sp. Y22]
MKSNIYVGNLSYNIEDSELKTLFSNVGEVVSINLIRDRDSGRGRGFGFIEMENGEDAKKAITELHDQEFMGRPLIVNLAKTRVKERTNRY